LTSITWWQCRRDPRHQWRATIANRAQLGTRCPFCAGKKVCKTNSLAAVEPEIARQWHPTKNGALNPRDVSCGSGKRVWWRCAAVPDHEWETAVCDRTGPRRARCPYCAGRALSVTNLLLAKAPDVAAEWHSVRNGKLKPKDVVAGSTRKAWWRCRADRSHEWEAAILIRTRGSGCPQCAAKRRVAAALAAREVAVRD